MNGLSVNEFFVCACINFYQFVNREIFIKGHITVINNIIANSRTHLRFIFIARNSTKNLQFINSCFFY